MLFYNIFTVLEHTFFTMKLFSQLNWTYESVFTEPRLYPVTDNRAMWLRVIYPGKRYFTVLFSNSASSGCLFEECSCLPSENRTFYTLSILILYERQWTKWECTVRSFWNGYHDFLLNSFNNYNNAAIAEHPISRINIVLTSMLLNISKFLLMRYEFYLHEHSKIKHFTWIWVTFS